MLKVDDVISLLETIPTKENRKKTFPNKVIFNMNFRIKEHFRRTNNPPQKVPQKGEPYQLIGEDVTLGSSRHIELLRFLWGGGYEDPIRIRGKEIIISRIKIIELRIRSILDRIINSNIPKKNIIE